MKLLLLCLSWLAVASATTSDDDIDEFLTMDPTPLLEDKAEWKVLFECLLDRGPCGDYEKIKEVLPDLVKNKCEPCDPEQKEKFESLLKLFLDKYPKDYAEATTKILSKPE